MIPANQGVAWSEGDQSALITLLQHGKPYRVIAEMLGRSKTSIYVRAQRLRPLKPVEDRRQTLVVGKENLADVYEIGWQVLHFEKDTVVCVWPHQTAPKLGKQSLICNTERTEELVVA